MSVNNPKNTMATKQMVSTPMIIGLLRKIEGFDGTTQIYDPHMETVVFSIKFKGKEPYTGSFSMHDAKKLGLTNHRLWQSIPVDMLAARAKQIACQKAKEMLRFLPECSKV